MAAGVKREPKNRDGSNRYHVALDHRALDANTSRSDPDSPHLGDHPHDDSDLVRALVRLAVNVRRRLLLLLAAVLLGAISLYSPSQLASNLAICAAITLIWGGLDTT